MTHLVAWLVGLTSTSQVEGKILADQGNFLRRLREGNSQDEGNNSWLNRSVSVACQNPESFKVFQSLSDNSLLLIRWP